MHLLFILTFTAALLASLPVSAQPAPKPVHQLRIQLIITANDGEVPDATQAILFKDYVEAIRPVYSPIGVELLFDPATDARAIASNNLNNDFPVRDGQTIRLPNAENPHHKSRQAIADQTPNRIVVFLRNGACCGKGFGAANFGTIQAPYLVLMGPLQKMPPRPGPSTTANIAAHELGHYFGLSHTFGHYALEPEDLVKFIQSRPGNPSDDEINALFDGDRLADTPPDPGATLFEKMHGLKPYQCGPQETIEIAVPIGNKTKTYTFKPDRLNIMSYFFRCPQLPQRRLSTQQGKIIRDHLEKGARRHLLAANRKP